MLITSKTFPNWEATKTNPKQSKPKATARNLETFVALASFILVQQKGLTKSSKHIAASEFRPLDTVLNYTHKCMIMHPDRVLHFFLEKLDTLKLR